jgi:hypothetical protein
MARWKLSIVSHTESLYRLKVPDERRGPAEDCCRELSVDPNPGDPRVGAAFIPAERVRLRPTLNLCRNGVFHTLLMRHDAQFPIYKKDAGARDPD